MSMSRTGLVNSHLQALRKLAKGFDADERKVVLEEIPVKDLIDVLMAKCDDMTSKIEKFEAIATGKE